MDFANKTAPGISGGILRTEHELDLKKFKMTDPIWLSGFKNINHIYLTAILYQPF